MRSSCRGILIIAVLAVAPVSFGATKPSAPATAPASTTGPLDLDVVVSAHQGKPIGRLHQQDFTVYLNKMPQPITGFRADEGSAAVPIETILLIDAVNASVSKVALARQGIDRFLKRNNGKLSQPTTLAILTDTGIRITPQGSRDGNQLAAFLDKQTIGVRDISRGTGIYGGIEQFQISASALERLAAMEQTRPGRKLLIWLSPGWPPISDAQVNLTSKQQNNLFTALVNLFASLRKARITLSSVDPLGTEDAGSYSKFYYEQFTKVVRSADKMQAGNLALQVLALESGGRVLNSSNDVSGEIATAASDADAFYTIEINPPPTERPNDYRAVTVRVDKPGLTARTCTGYYAQP